MQFIYNLDLFINNLPREFELHPYIDYDLQFDKSFIEPLKLILEKIRFLDFEQTFEKVCATIERMN